MPTTPLSMPCSTRFRSSLSASAPEKGGLVNRQARRAVLYRLGQISGGRLVIIEGDQRHACGVSGDTWLELSRFATRASGRNSPLAARWVRQRHGSKVGGPAPSWLMWCVSWRVMRVHGCRLMPVLVSCVVPAVGLAIAWCQHAQRQSR